MTDQNFDDIVTKLVTDYLLKEMAGMVEDLTPDQMELELVKTGLAKALSEQIAAGCQLVDEALEDAVQFLEHDIDQLKDDMDFEFELLNADQDTPDPIEENFETARHVTYDIWPEDGFGDLDRTPIGCNSCGDPEPVDETPEDGTVEVDWNSASEVDWSDRSKL